MNYVFCAALWVGILAGKSVTLASDLMKIDSVGSERVGGKIFVLHKVDPGQTMFAVVRQYSTSIHALREANPGMSDAIQTGQTIRVPYTPKVAKKDQKKDDPKTEAKADLKQSKPAAANLPVKPTNTIAPPATTTPSAASLVSVAPDGLHRVEAGETLYRVAVKYGVLMADIRKWNNLTDDNLKDGQLLIVSEKSEEKSAPTTVSAPAPKVITNVVKDSVKAKTLVAEKVVKPVEEVAPPKVVKGKSKSESGLAEGIETDESTSKFLGLHRTAPIGSLVQVLNEYNQESIIVRIIGRIPDTSSNDDIVIKLSSRAFEKVSPNSKRFRAVVSYLE
jgi:LysM repeat protein